ncbi:CYTH domain-containing protein [Aestuariibacter halophilus]|uniref:CYTH domain-containing protein n=1 Tax=Fluctibacter halophilus TaxID=226011 RepID=A0ABS8GFK7_9ALTE|nr:CYTH domain-containing protein [Aestuariibacter halophilus]MCC2617971.1 CYTH domain-containing protein [Aestuariibacter halophilus]
MEQEIELKLLVTEKAKGFIQSSLLQSLTLTGEPHHFHLFNQYFDTPGKDLRGHDIGLRVRCREGQYEQTIKTAGKIIGGLHQRPEYNVPLDGDTPDLEAFPAEVWPADVSVSRLQASLTPLFSTDFTRHCYDIAWSEDCVIEMVLDEGVIRSGSHTLPICEIELELKKGDPSALFELAEKIVQGTPCQLGQLSKAARGYMLAADQLLRARPLPAFLSVRPQDTCETGFCRGLEGALAHWQHHEQVYLQSGKVTDLDGVVEGMRVALQALTLYLPSLQCEPLLSLHKALMAQVSHWHWLEQAVHLKLLRSRKGPYRKRLGKNDELVAFLRGCSDSLLNRHHPQQLLMQPRYVSVQLALVKLLVTRPWRQASENWHSTLIEHAKGWLSQGWHNVLQSMPFSQSLTAQDYVYQQSALRQTLYNGFLLGNLFDEENRDRFRAPWLDLLDGIAELKVLLFLQEKLSHADLANKSELLLWSNEQIHALLAVMEKSRNVAMDVDAYW